ncbi:electron transfer flavoprotein subunit beta/FixA family protein [Lacrimispora sp.]|uniref:electron transfer flavoprotein subunit beta/FixA family protein n=1 Tax=Lacrimispora sp. TaxID=2719234 RepID=UPI00289BB874|nr:electron transfer flavoprotein subunit beta/FixA family protein [Lacrimispora sp.]
MNIIVCIKQVPDTTEVRLNPETGTLIRDGVPSIINPDDKAGLEAALRLKDAHGGKVIVLTMGPLQADVALREALAMGADEAYLISDRAFGGADTWATSSTIASAIRKIGGYDLIITGRQAIDGDTAQVGPQIAEHLDLPGISYAEDIEIIDEYVVVKRQYEDRSHVIKAKMPCLITALSELNQPRYMTPGGIKEAYHEKEIKMLARADLDVEDGNIGLKGSPTRVFKSFTKAVKGKGTIVHLDAPEAAEWLLGQMKEKFVI